MKPQERVNAILQAKVEPSWKILLVAIASHMSDTQLLMWACPETLALESGLSRSTVMELLKAMAARGVITRLDEGRRAKTTRIIWEVLATQEPVQTRRGGRQGSEHRTVVSEHRTSEDRTVQSDNRTDGSEHRTGRGPITGLQGSDNRTRSDQGTDHHEPTIEPTRGEEPTQTIHGTQATVVIPAEPVVESPLVDVLSGAGLAPGQVAAVARKLLEAGIQSPTDEAAAVYDDFSLGNLVGNQHKGKVIPAFRRAGWLPPKERRQSMSALPPGMKIIDEKGNPVGVVPSTKAEKKAVETDDWFAALRNSVQKEEVTLGE